MSNTNSNFEKIIKSNRKSHDEFTKSNSWKNTQKRGYGSKRYAGWENN